MDLYGTTYRFPFEWQQKHLDYSVTGEENESTNTIRCKIPDSLGGANISGGDCVVDVLMDNKKSTIKQISIVGLYFYDSQQKKARGFNIYDRAKKRMSKPFNEDCKQYTPFIRNFVSELSFKRLTKVTSTETHVYCRLIFPGG